MNLRVMGGLTGALAAVLVAGCVEDPTASRAGTPSRIAINPSVLFLDEGATGNLTAVALDELTTPLPGGLSFSSSAPAVASVAAGGGPPVPNGVSTPVTVTALQPGPAYIRFSGQGLSDSARVNVLPLTFGGALSTTTPQGGDTMTIASTAVLKFDVATVTATFGGGHEAVILSKTPDLLTLIAPFSDPGPVTLTGILPTYLPSAITLQTTSAVTQTGDAWPGTGSWQTAPDITSLLPGSGQSAIFVATTTSPNNRPVCPEFVLLPPQFASSGPCMMFRFTLAAPTTLNFTTSWEGTAAAPDVDIYACSDSTVANFGTACFEDGGAGATGDLPQSTGDFMYPAGTHWFVIENYSGAGARNIVTTISQP